MLNKQAVYDWLLLAMEEKEAALALAWSALMESNQQEGKSSSGDKHETGRAMVHLELEQLNKQRQECQRQKEEILQYAPTRVNLSQEVRAGSWVITNVGLYYMITGWGKVNLQGKEVLIIGMGSPVGKALIGKRVGEEFGWGIIKGKIAAIE